MVEPRLLPAWRRLEVDEAQLPMQNRLVHGAGRIDRSAVSRSGPSDLREEQIRVFADFATYLTDLATSPPSEHRAPFCRIIQPPRTGKTVVAGHIIDRTGLTATFLVPTRALVDQTVRELTRRIPGAAIGSYCGDHALVVGHGINVVTYAMLQTHAADLPAEIRRSALVFVDEAHHAMTASRMAILTQAFDPLAVRVALTATPDYDDERRLAHYFPDLIHEITLEEALALELLAPLRVWVAEVDADGSHVSFVAGDFKVETLGRLMSSAPFFRAAEVFRYDPENARLAALIACTSRQQAYDLFLYLKRHRPKAAPAPALVLGDTPREVREKSLAKFEAGAIDTIIQVGVLVEGWSSPRCKLLLDLAPSLSRVRATQKYFRVMTRNAGHEARIFVLLPKNLPRPPVLPMDLFGRPLDEYVCGQLLGKTADDAGGTAPIQRGPRTPIAGVELKQRIVLTAVFEKPALDPGSALEVRQVLASSAEFHPGTCGVYRFAGLGFRHRLFTGRGDFLLRWLKVPMTRDGYDRFLGRLYPEDAANRILTRAGERDPDRWCADDLRRFHRVFGTPSPTGRPEEPFASTWYALSGTSPGPSEGLEADCIARQGWRLVLTQLARLTRRQRAMVIGYYGLFGKRARTFAELAEIADISSTRVAQIVNRALRKLRQWLTLTAEEDALLAGPDVGIVADVVRRKAQADAERARYLDELFSRQDAEWECARNYLSTRSASDHEQARIRLQELAQAADRQGARAAFDLRLDALRAVTPGARCFWRCWPRSPDEVRDARPGGA
jgi:DNA-directed RNA polymerase specialized sigma24 family protein